MTAGGGFEQWGHGVATPAPADPAAPAAATAQTRVVRNPRGSTFVIAVVTLLAVAGLAYVALGLGGGGNAAAQATAQSITLTAADLPGFVLQPPDDSSDSDPTDARMKSCLGSAFDTALSGNSGLAHAATDLASGSGADAQQVDSSAQIERSDAAVAGDFATLEAAPLASCLSQSMNGAAQTTASGVSLMLDNVVAKPFTPPAEGADRSYGLRIAATLVVAGEQIPMNMDLFLYGVGRDELSLMTTTMDAPFSIAQRERMAGLMITRALAHSQ